MKPSVTIEIEGVAGCGKSRCADAIAEALRDLGVEVTVNDGGRQPQSVLRFAPGTRVTINVEQT